MPEAARVSRPACPKCKSPLVHRSRWKPGEQVLRLVRCRPYRCEECEHRYYGRAEPPPEPAPDAPRPRPWAAILGSGIAGLGVLAWGIVHFWNAAPPAIAPAVAKAVPPPAAAPVPVPAAPVKENRPVEEPARKSAGTFEVQLGAFRTAASAEKLGQLARSRNLPVRTRRPGPGSRTRLYHVLLDQPFARQREAEKMAGEIRREHAIKAIVMRVEE